MKVTQSRLSLRPHGLYSLWNSPDQNTGVGSPSLLQGIFPIEELNRGLLHCRKILYQLSYQGSLQDPVVAPHRILVLLRGIKPTSPALQGGFLTTGPSWKSLKVNKFYGQNANCLAYWGKVGLSFLLHDAGRLNQVLCDNLEGWDGWEVGGRFKGDWTYVYLWLIHVDVWQKPTQYCKTIILQLKKNLM